MGPAKWLEFRICVVWAYTLCWIICLGLLSPGRSWRRIIAHSQMRPRCIFGWSRWYLPFWRKVWRTNCRAHDSLLTKPQITWKRCQIEKLVLEPNRLRAFQIRHYVSCQGNGKSGNATLHVSMSGLQGHHHIGNQAARRLHILRSICAQLTHLGPLRRMYDCS